MSRLWSAKALAAKAGVPPWRLVAVLKRLGIEPANSEVGFVLSDEDAARVLAELRPGRGRGGR